MQREVQLAREKGIATPAVLHRRAAAAEEAFLGLAAALVDAPDPVPLLRANAALTRSAAGGQLTHSQALMVGIFPRAGTAHD